VVPLVLDVVGEPRPKITVRDAHSDEVVAMLLDGVIDIGFVLPGARPPPLRFVALAPDPVVAVCSSADDLARAHRTPLAGLRGRPIALNRWGAGAEQFVDQLRAVGVTDDQFTECSDGITAMRLARDHGYLALVTQSLASDPIQAGELTRVKLSPSPQWSVPLAFAYRSADRHQPIIAALRDRIAQTKPRPSRRS
jgi:DNA-binding transcriptional LysR family regulator